MSAVRFELARALALRSTWLLGLVTVGLHAVASAAVAAFVAFGPQPDDGYGGEEVVRFVLASPPFLPLGVGVMGAVLGGMDHRHRLYELSVLVTPRRGVLLAAKASLAVVFSVVLAVAGVVIGYLSLAATGLRLEGGDVGLVVGQVGHVVAWGLAGLLLGLALRSQAAAGVALAVGALLVEPVLRAASLALPEGWWTQVPRYLMFAGFDGLVPPAEVGGSVFATSAGPTVGTAVLVTIGYLGLLGLVAWRSMRGEPGGRRPSVA